MVASQSPTALKWWFAVEMRRMRDRKGLSREDAARAIKGSTQGIGHIESGRSLPKPLELDKLLELYGQTERAEFFHDLRDMAKKGKDWWISFGPSVRSYFNLFLGLESSSPQIEGWDALVPPGLFQTADYAEGVIRAGYVDLPGTDIRPLVELRMARQHEVLERDQPARVWRVIDEAALRRIVGSREVTKAQLEHLAALAERPNVDVQIVPLDAGAHTGTEGTFTLLSAPPELENYPGCVYVETLVKGYYYEELEEITRYRNALTRLRVQAIKPEDSPAFIRQIAKDL
ncbi:helix-turn-helix transcriptional regulator [Kibdelosporangium persicum]|uniref:Transcriptional regulator n=1 Tax=Kibdelosporangium persicum TaxID=2698649 RepID=A0ABX2FID0_9PSEU|nr:helix-turn-helix transcriptional regulator [Kibdelosporangium persicum]NRN70485.1 Transcriptional regulator [Kibdelosporangium persicum]